MIHEVIEYVPKRTRKDNLGRWFALALAAVLALIYFGKQAEDVQRATREREAVAREKKIDRLRDAAILQRLEDIDASAARARREDQQAADRLRSEEAVRLWQARQKAEENRLRLAAGLPPVQ